MNNLSEWWLNFLYRSLTFRFIDLKPLTICPNSRISLTCNDLWMLLELNKINKKFTPVTQNPLKILHHKNRPNNVRFCEVFVLEDMDENNVLQHIC